MKIQKIINIIFILYNNKYKNNNKYKKLKKFFLFKILYLFFYIYIYIYFLYLEKSNRIFCSQKLFCSQRDQFVWRQKYQTYEILAKILQLHENNRTINDQFLYFFKYLYIY